MLLGLGESLADVVGPFAMSELPYHQPNRPLQSTDSSPKAEELLAEEKSTVERILNSQVIIDRHPQHRRNLFHNFVDFKKVFDRVWHAGLWQVFRSFNIEEGLVQVIQAVCPSGGVHQGCLLSPILFNLFLEKIMQETLHDHHTFTSIGGRPICNLQFASDISLRGGNNGELEDLTDRQAAT